MCAEWAEKIKKYCEKYNLPIVYIAETLYEPKVVPMIRGKAFEFSVMLALQEVLPENEWIVKKVPQNAQLGMHDVDVLVTHKATEKDIYVECKLAAKGSFRQLADESVAIKVKCMRSRTLGESMVAALAPKLGIPKKQLQIHNDQYLPENFDVVITSIGNAFYGTNPRTGLFEWSPSDEGIEFLEFLRSKSEDRHTSLQEFAFNQLYAIEAKNLIISKDNGIVCTRRKCLTPDDCGFIPNYPIIRFDAGSYEPSNGWVLINRAADLLQNLL